MSNSVGIIAQDFIYDNSKVSSSRLLDHMILYIHAVNEPINISGSQLDHVFIKSDLLEEFHEKLIVQSIYFCDHDAEKSFFQKNDVGFRVSK